MVRVLLVRESSRFLGRFLTFVSSPIRTVHLLGYAGRPCERSIVTSRLRARPGRYFWRAQNRQACAMTSRTSMFSRVATALDVLIELPDEVGNGCIGAASGRAGQCSLFAGP